MRFPGRQSAPQQSPGAQSTGRSPPATASVQQPPDCQLAPASWLSGLPAPQRHAAVDTALSTTNTDSPAAGSGQPAHDQQQHQSQPGSSACNQQRTALEPEPQNHHSLLQAYSLRQPAFCPQEFKLRSGNRQPAN